MVFVHIALALFVAPLESSCWYINMNNNCWSFSGLINLKRKYNESWLISKYNQGKVQATKSWNRWMKKCFGFYNWNLLLWCKGDLRSENDFSVFETYISSSP